VILQILGISEDNTLAGTGLEACGYYCCLLLHTIMQFYLLI
jgi:hypothetical protein